jgi:hypothetical protein
MRGQPFAIRSLLDKAKESALLAVEIYNKPTAVFRSGTYIVLMVIAWSALLQAIFHKKKINCYERKPNGRYVKDNGEKKVLSISKLTSAYFKDADDPIRKNIEFFIPLRDRIEHKSYPEIDKEIFAECQALLMNFEDVLEREFPKETPLRQNLVFALQFSTIANKQQNEVARRRGQQDFAQVLAFIRKYREDLPDNIWAGQKFSFRVFLIQKVSNNKHSDDVAVEFLRYDPSKPEDIARLEKLHVLIKDKPVPSQEIYKFKPGNVSLKVADAIGKPFTIAMHTKAWRYYGVRPAGATGIGCNQEYCLFDEAHKDHVYSEKWVSFLSTKMKDQNEYEQVRAQKLS